MNAENTKGRSREGTTDWDRLDAITDREIEEAVASDPDTELLDENFWKRAKVVLPEGKQTISLRVDRDVLNWFRKQGKGYQTHMNRVLRAYMEARQ